MQRLSQFFISLILFFNISNIYASGAAHYDGPAFPKPLEEYQPIDSGVMDTLASRIAEEPFNLLASLIFLVAILHTFSAGFLNNLSHKVQHNHTQKMIASGQIGKEHKDVSFLAQLLHYLGEVEAVFGFWAAILFVIICFHLGWHGAVHFMSTVPNFTEPMFVVVIMAISATRPVLNFSENMLKILARIGKESVASWWLVILIFAPVLGSFITEPAAMTIASLLLSKQFFRLKPSNKFKYATVGLLFTNISVGGTLTNFAAPPVLMVATRWEWSSMFMLTHFGWKAVVGIALSTVLFFFYFRKEFVDLEKAAKEHKEGDIEMTSEDHTNLVPKWIITVHLAFLGWTVLTSHHPVLFIGGFLIFLAFADMTPQHQNRLNLKSPLLVGFFLAGLVIHSAFQGWWIAPVLGSFSEVPLMIASSFLTSFNDNAAITLLASLVPDFSEHLKYAVVAGAVTGGGLTVIANAPNPAGKAILAKFFTNNSLSPLGLAAGAIIPTIIVGCAFMML